MPAGRSGISSLGIVGSRKGGGAARSGLSPKLPGGRQGRGPKKKERSRSLGRESVPVRSPFAHAVTEYTRQYGRARLRRNPDGTYEWYNFGIRRRKRPDLPGLPTEIPTYRQAIEKKGRDYRHSIHSQLDSPVTMHTVETRMGERSPVVKKEDFKRLVASDLFREGAKPRLRGTASRVKRSII